MNPKPISETEAIRSDIEMTRRRMDDTIDALGERIRGRHLLDEVIGYFRHNTEKTSEAGARVREKLSETAGKISESAGSAASAALDTVKKNPLPFVLIAAGAAWLTYSTIRSRRADVEEDLEELDYDPDTHYDRPLEYPASSTIESEAKSAGEGYTDEAGSKLSQLKDKAAAATDQVKEKLSGLSQSTREKFDAVKTRASEFGTRVKDRSQEIYGKARDKAVQTVDERPIEVGLGCLVAGVLVGLSLPTPEPVHRIAGPHVDKLRNRTREAGRDLLQKGKRVAQAAGTAAKEEAQSQGLTMDRLRQSGRAVAESAGAAAQESAREQGLVGNENAGGATDPSAARPAM